MTKKFLITEDIMDRFCILQEVLQKRITLKDAALILGLSYRQAIRLKKRLLQNGLEGLQRKAPPKPPNLKLTPDLIQKIIHLKTTLYYDFNISHFKDKLASLHNISLSYETLRQILIKNGLHQPKKKRKFYKRRKRMPKAGMLVQMDSSLHQWIENVPEKWWLIAMIDDADSFVYAKFYPKETALANMEVIRTYLEKRGLFKALYVDRASHFKTTRHSGVHYQVGGTEYGETQIERALKELGITLIHAYTPQAKGRIERLFRFFQDRLIKELRLKGIRDYQSANKFLQEEFLPWYNSRYKKEVESSYKPLSLDKDLDLVFSLRYARRVNKDNTIRYLGRIYQVMPSGGVKNFSGRWVEVCEKMDGEVVILYENKKILFVEIGEDEYRVMKERGKEELLSKRELLEDKEVKKPSPDHPWRKGWKVKKKDVTFQTGKKV
ncbi:MAG: ISNCY family transposase [Caldimicrobium sp.]